MTETTVLTDSSYQKLLRDLRTLIEAGKRRAQTAATRELVVTYWELGKRIAEERLVENAGYGESILEDLAEDLEMDLSNLKQSLYFFQRFQKGVPRDTNLTWSHFKALIPIRDDEARAFYQREAERQGWRRAELREAIKRNLYEAQGKRGGEGRSPSGKLRRPVSPSYVYKAMVEKVVDADTLLFRIDLGFQVWKEQRVRLAGIDCPPIDTRKGYEAFEYVRDQLAKAPFIVVRTNKIDIYGRYVADVFYSFTEKRIEKVFVEGRYLNQELLDRGFAKLI